ncbi:MAG: cohesin domain-containing protein [Patescibacteria group bacterium]|nr:cohesin domain-containing protein [Patescibacteria group bacterium]
MMLRKPAQLFLCLTVLIIFCGMRLFVTPASAASATLELIPGESTLSFGDTLDVDIVVDSGEALISGVDVVIDFDPDKFDISMNVDDSAFSTFMPTTGRIDNTTGEINFSAYTEAEETVSGEAIVGTLELTPLVDSGEEGLIFDFTLGETEDCNVIEAESVDDILNSVTNGVYTFEAGATTTETTTTEDSTEEDVDQLPETTDTPETGEGELSVFFFLLGCSLLFSGLLLVF